jgi:uncharacterized protein YndB with AHSA1/START domain
MVAVPDGEREEPLMPPIEHEQTIEAPQADVWRFIVDPAALSAWFGADAWLEPELGAAVRFRFADGRERRGAVTEVETGRRLTWRWRELHGAGLTGLVVGAPSSVSIELRPAKDAEATIVTITETADHPAGAAEARG